MVGRSRLAAAALLLVALLLVAALTVWPFEYGLGESTVLVGGGYLYLVVQFTAEDTRFGG